MDPSVTITPDPSPSGGPVTITPDAPSDATIAVPSAGRIPGVMMPSPKVTPGQAAGGIAAGAAAGAAPFMPSIVGPVARAGTQFMRNHPILTMGALEAAKHIPGVGPYVSKIPSWLPLLAGGKGGAAAGEEAEGAEGVSQVRPPLVDQVKSAPPSAPSSRPPLIQQMQTQTGDPLLNRVRNYAAQIQADEPVGASPEEQDLTPILQESLKQAMQRKALRQE